MLDYMRHRVLDPIGVLAGYDAVSLLYAYVPPLSQWGAREYGAYTIRLFRRILPRIPRRAAFSLFVIVLDEARHG